jgi:CheY-like chemotaxis protein
MNHISILIVDDDLVKISSIIKTIREIYNETLSISQASCVQEAIENLQSKEFHLLITDLQMPLKHDDSKPNNNGGKSLVKNIYRARNKVNVPMYIVGLTQFKELKNDFEGVWKVWHYDPRQSEWKENMRDLIHHISLVKSRVLMPKIETIFVEGPIDKKIIEATISNYFKEQSDNIYIDTIKYGGGASWVERQLFIWAKSLITDAAPGEYLKAVGIFDNDDAGIKAIVNLRKSIPINTAEDRTFSIIKNSYKYSPILKSIKTKGITFPTVVEDLIDIECWKEAMDKGWLTGRNLNSIKINDSILALSIESINEDELKKRNFTNEEILIITHKVNDEYKKKFSNLVCMSDQRVLIPIKYLMEDVFVKLNKNLQYDR